MDAGPKCWTIGHQGAKKWPRAVPHNEFVMRSPEATLWIHSVLGPVSLTCTTAVEDTEVLFMLINRFLESLCNRTCQHSEPTAIVL